MKANELRIGNYISYRDEWYCEVQSLGSYFETHNKDLTDYLHGIMCGSDDIQDYNPIALTEEWLLNFGFEKKKYKTSIIEIDIVYYEFNGHQVYLIDGKDKCFEFEYNIPETKERFNLFRSFSHVHQLQNLYFALTGEELQLK